MDLFSSLNPEQLSAVQYLDGPLLVLAGPGTGKTQLLSARVAYALKNTDLAPQNILCITYTDAGASNMVARLTSMIGRDAGKITISTYHSFGKEILSYYKNYSDSYRRNLDQSIDDVTRHKIVNRLQDSLPANDILRGDKIKDIIDTISSAKSARLTPDDLAKIAAQNIEDGEILSSALSPILQNVKPRVYEPNLENVYRPIYEILKKHISDAPILKNVPRTINALAESLEIALNEAENKKSIAPLTKWKGDNFEFDKNKNYRLKENIANKKLASFANIYRDYETHLVAAGLFDYDDMIEEAIKVLRKDDGFRLTLSERYQFILLDEFQDTNPSQLEIVHLLTDYEKPLIMAVGDDDQAIYEFQGAKSSNFTDFRDHYHPEIISLNQNYRSTQEILDFSRQIINQIPQQFEKKPLIAVNSTPASASISRHEFMTSDAEYSWIANQISDLIKSGIAPSDIAIITRKHNFLASIVSYLNDKKISVSYEKNTNLFEEEKISEIFALCRFIAEIAAEKTPRHRLLEILTFPFWGVSPASVISVIENAQISKRSSLDCLIESKDPELKKIGEFFSSLVAISFNSPLEMFLDYLIGRVELNGYKCPFYDYYTQKTDYSTFELYESLSVLRDAVRSHVQNESPRLKDLIELLDDYEEANYPLSKKSPYKDSSNSVQVMTAHSSKGLEFKYVFITTLDHNSWGKGKGNNNLLTLPSNLQFIRHTGNTEEERVRLLYVAITRAKQTLFLTNSKHNSSGQEVERLEYFGEYFDPEKNAVISPYLNNKPVIIHDDALSQETEKPDLHPSWVSSYFHLTPELKPILKKKIEHYRLSATDLTNFIDIAYSGPAEFYKKKVLGAPADPENTSIALGNLIHTTFEHVTDLKVSDEEAIEFFKSEAKKTSLTQNEIKKIIEIGELELSHSLPVFGAELRAPNSRAEVNLKKDNIVVNGVPLTGAIDHISIDEENKTIEIYDFKTGKIEKGKWDSNIKLFKYALQLAFYKLLLNNSALYSKYKISRGHILFVRPDKEGEVYDKTFDFTEEFEEKLKTLITAVYNQIKSLDFINDPELNRESDRSLKVKDIEEFIQLLLAK